MIKVRLIFLFDGVGAGHGGDNTLPGIIADKQDKYGDYGSNDNAKEGISHVPTQGVPCRQEKQGKEEEEEKGASPVSLDMPVNRH
jgi:hypothetical protein